MGGRDNAYSRLVFWLKILLPLAALAILSTMFLVARTIDPSRAIPYAKVDVNALARDSRITNPSYSGVTPDGSAIAVTAALVRPVPDQPGHATAVDLTARMNSQGGSSAEMRSATGEIDTPANRVTFTGDVKLDTSADYHIQTAHLTSSLNEARVEATGGVTATGPMVTLTATAMTLAPDAVNKAEYVLVFNGDVKLVYQPGQ
ncbi:MAG: hypothetical protein GC186_01870 [Rhodobacteraceae bacterium]|nr:hypothetical protein [Paracoccaceae bacterium]